MTLTLLEAGEMAVRPPMIAQEEVLRSDAQLFAGGITYVDAEYDERLGEALRPILTDKNGIVFGMQMNEQTRSLLGSIFYLNKLTLPPADREMTAYETSERIKEYIRSALPLFEPMELSYNGQICEETSTILLDGGAFGPIDEIPHSLRNADLRFKFKSPISEAVDRQKGQRFLEAKNLLREAVEVDRASLAMLDMRKALRDALTGIGTPAAWLRSEQDVEDHAHDVSDQDSAQRAAATVNQGAVAAQEVAKAQQALNGAG